MKICKKFHYYMITTSGMECKICGYKVVWDK